jgi:hypothetical protein
MMTARELIEQLKRLTERQLDMPVLIDGIIGDVGADEMGYVPIGNVGVLPSRRILLD